MTNAPGTGIPQSILDATALADASWRPVLREGLEAMAAADPAYLPGLETTGYLPTEGRIFAAFEQPFDAVRYVLVGEGPYPRPESATGVCFMDGAVDALWSEKGLSKPVNRATSLRNFMKMLLVVEGLLLPEKTSGDAIASIAIEAQSRASTLIRTRAELQQNLVGEGFLLLNASLVYRPEVAPLKDAKAWQPLIGKVLDALLSRKEPAPTLVLWGKVAEQLKSLEAFGRFPKAISEHPYNLSFIANPMMQELFKPMHLLRKRT